MSSGPLTTLLQDLHHLDVSVDIRLGELRAIGGYADIYDGVLAVPGGEVKKVSIKRFRTYADPEKDFAKVIAREMRVWANLKHVNVLPLLGFIVSANYPSLVSEWMENGSLSTFVKAHSKMDFMKMVRGIANGLLYLHQNGVIHSDLKCDNILITPEGTPVLCDFGISRVLVESVTVTGTSDLKGSCRWMAIELLDTSFRPEGQTHELHTRESDVWAFGMVVYEMISENIPFAHIISDTVVMIAIVKGETPRAPPDIIASSSERQQLWKLCQQCWNPNPSIRPSMETIMGLINRPMTCTIVRQIKGKAGDVRSLTFSPDGKRFATGSWLGAVKIWDRDGDLLVELPSLHRHVVFGLSFSPDSSKLATASFDGNIYVWDSRKGRLLLGPLKGMDHELFKFVSYTNNGEELIAATSSESRFLYRWYSKTGKPVCAPVKLPINPEDDDPEENRQFAFYSFALSGDKTLITGSGSFEKRVIQWDIQTGEVSGPIYYDHKNTISSVSVSPDGKRVATACWDETIHIWDLASGKRVCEPLRGHTSWVQSVSYSPSGRFIVSGSIDRNIIIWDAHTGAIQCGPLHGQDGSISDVRFSLDEKHVISTASDTSVCAGDGTVVIWEIRESI